MNITDQAQSKDAWKKFNQPPQERDSAELLPDGRWEGDARGRGRDSICQHSPDKQLSCARFLPLYRENKLHPFLMLLQGRVSPFHKAISKQESLC